MVRNVPDMYRMCTIRTEVDSVKTEHGSNAIRIRIRINSYTVPANDIYVSNFTAYVIFGTPPEEYEGLIH
jgi:hypothetical protein